MPARTTENLVFETMAVVGVGLIGGSLGMAVKKRGLIRKVVGVGRTEQKLMRAKILGAIDDYSMDFESGCAEADLVVICTPVGLVSSTLARLAPSLKEGAVVTDVGSTKAEIVRECEGIIPEGRYFVGGHPMAGSEQTGVEAAYPDMFLGATYVLTGTDQTDLESLGRMTELVEAIGARAEMMTPEQHDAAAATISHMPHAMAAALLLAAEQSQRESGKVFRLAAGSFRDLTRISGSSPELWRDICLTNADALSAAIGRLEERLGQFRQALEDRDAEAVERFFELAAKIRETYLRVNR